MQLWYNGKLGFPLRLAHSQDFFALAFAHNIPQLKHDGMRVAIRIYWPGYGEWKDTMAITDNTAERRPFTRAQLAHAIAKVVHKFYNDMSQVPSTEADHDWWLSRIPLEELCILELRHVSKGSWQPVLSRVY